MPRRSPRFLPQEQSATEGLLSLNNDCLAGVISAIDSGDLLPFALTCKAMRGRCIVRADAERAALELKLRGTKDAKASYPRWNTHGASSMSRIKWAVDLTHGNLPIDDDWVCSAAFHGQLDLVVFLMDTCKIECDPCVVPSPLNAAAEGGSIPVMNELRERGFDWSGGPGDACCAAANGHLEALKWMKNDGCPLRATCCTAAAFNGQLKVLKWLREQGCPWARRDEENSEKGLKELCLEAAEEGGHTATIEWIRAQEKEVVACAREDR